MNERAVLKTSVLPKFASYQFSMKIPDFLPLLGGKFIPDAVVDLDIDADCVMDGDSEVDGYAAVDAADVNCAFCCRWNGDTDDRHCITLLKDGSELLV